MKKSTGKWNQFVATALMLVIGAVCGVFIGRYVELVTKMSVSSWAELGWFVAMLACLYLIIFLQIIFHEAGHLVGGLLTGYGFSSFRIGSLIWVKDGGKLRAKKLSVAGTGGQCLMVPPDMVDGAIPFVLYNLGGSLANLISAALCALGYFAFASVPLLQTMCMMFALIGVGFALLNGFPMRMGGVDNDGYNIVSLSKSKDALRAFWIQMKTNHMMAGGVRPKDMPQEWFVVPPADQLGNSMVAAVAVLACNRLLDAHEFEKADELMERLLQMDTGIVGLHRSMLICDRMYCQLIGENRREQLDILYDKQQVSFMKSMKNYPSIIRTEYAYARLAQSDADKASKIMARFEKCAKAYPYPVDIQSERELIAIVDGKWAEEAKG